MRTTVIIFVAKILFVGVMPEELKYVFNGFLASGSGEIYSISSTEASYQRKWRKGSNLECFNVSKNLRSGIDVSLKAFKVHDLDGYNLQVLWNGEIAWSNVKNLIFELYLIKNDKYLQKISDDNAMMDAAQNGVPFYYAEFKPENNYLFKGELNFKNNTFETFYKCLTFDQHLHLKETGSNLKCFNVGKNLRSGLNVSLWAFRNQELGGYNLKVLWNVEITWSNVKNLEFELYLIKDDKYLQKISDDSAILDAAKTGVTYHYAELNPGYDYLFKGKFNFENNKVEIMYKYLKICPKDDGNFYLIETDKFKNSPALLVALDEDKINILIDQSDSTVFKLSITDLNNGQTLADEGITGVSFDIYPDGGSDYLVELYGMDDGNTTFVQNYVYLIGNH